MASNKAAVEFLYGLVQRHALPPKLRESVDIFSLARGGHGARGYGKNRYGVDVGWWVHPERYRKEMRFLLQALNLQGNERILTIACGPAFHEIAIAKHFPGIKIVATDLDPKEIKTARRLAQANGVSNIEFRQMEATELSKLSGQRFDHVISLAALHDVPDLRGVFRGVSHVLKSNGRFVFTYNPGRRRVQFPHMPSLEQELARDFNLKHSGPLITPRNALHYYGKVERKSREQRGYGLVQEARIAKLKTRRV